MGIQGSDYGYSTPERPILRSLVEAQVLVIREETELSRCVILTEACDDHYSAILTAGELRLLAQELLELAQLIDPKK